jgi:hypothetical protein
MPKPLVPCPVCPECGRILGGAAASLAEANDGLCCDCLIDLVEAGKLTHAVEYDAEPVEVSE